MQNYKDLLSLILLNGEARTDRTGTGTFSLFGHQMRFDLSKGFPLLTTKKLHIKSIIHELLWFLSGNTNATYLRNKGVSIWDEWADENGDLGPIYGKQWREWQGNNETIDQIANLINDIKFNPNSRRMLVSAWNPSVLPISTIRPKDNVQYGKQALPPCHYSWQVYVCGGKLSLMFNMRSTDVFLGLPYNIASYAFLAHMLAHVCGLEVGELIYSGGDVHLYTNHVQQAQEQLTRECLPLSTLTFARQVDNIFDFTFEDFIISNYTAHPPIKAPVAV